MAVDWELKVDTLVIGAGGAGLSTQGGLMVDASGRAFSTVRLSHSHLFAAGEAVQGSRAGRARRILLGKQSSACHRSWLARCPGGGIRDQRFSSGYP